MNSICRVDLSEVTLLGEDGLSKDSVDEDKCRLMKDSVLQGFKDFCTSRGDACTRPCSDTSSRSSWPGLVTGVRLS